MLKKVKNMMISKAVKVAEVFTKEEKGASDIVAIIVIIAIIMVVSAIFREQLTGAVKKVFVILTGNPCSGNLHKEIRYLPVERIDEDKR